MDQEKLLWEVPSTPTVVVWVKNYQILLSIHIERLWWEKSHVIKTKRKTKKD